MPSTIWKYDIPATEEIALDMPENAVILTAQFQPDMNGIETAYIWAMVNPDAPKERRTFRLLGTGWPVEDKVADFLLDWRYVSTVITRGWPSFVWHLFEKRNRKQAPSSQPSTTIKDLA